ncbi:MAG: DUF1800 family protein, partial [Acidobacteriota bacterium]|nr:DUF1800 family protein [Acidobacteriota bacterium]
MNRTQERAADDALTAAERRHLLRRLAFAATPVLERTLEGLSGDEALGVLLRAARDAPYPERPEAARGVWGNPALRFEGVSDEDFEAIVDRQAQDARAAIEGVRRWWLAELLTSPAPLRENLVLFLHGVFGSSTGSVDAPHALHGRNALLRRQCLGTVPDLLASLVVDPAMMMQVGMDDHRRLRVSDRPAKLILDHWTVGEGAYDPRDIEELSRALTGWLLVAPEGREPARPIAPRAPRAARRTGLVPTFRPEEFDAAPKTILGRTGSFDARSAVRWLASHEATARRFGRLLIAHLGIEDPDGALEARLAASYRATGGSIEALLREVVRSDAFWSESSRWALIKSPVHLAAGACRQLGIASPPIAEIDRWLRASGQSLFDTPGNGEGGWPGQEAWVEPPARLTVRYHLAAALAGRLPPLGLERGGTAGPRSPGP